MNKLRKLHPTIIDVDASQNSQTGAKAVQSRTMTMALSTAIRATTSVAQSVSAPSFPPEFKPKTYKEQYWAARATVAEAAWHMSDAHHREVQQITNALHEERSVCCPFVRHLRELTNGHPQREINAVHQMHETRHARLEWLNVSCTSILAMKPHISAMIHIVPQIFLIGILVTLFSVTLYIFSANSRVATVPHSLHFTIPFLSPFTSVVSTIQARTSREELTCRSFRRSNMTHLSSILEHLLSGALLQVV